eukprot:gnl/TRDRNA2_/TRDRNA2_175359_c0_seq7.p1 gnl/TRDRNA2_/TRDRNA2_175359_c0~~gnl/TRDRNA2_/TRDRNA2_175359_c0_seq7.p1  ORF type:complete len:485 (-),score=72.43 gnl/TRDRNA2_/TRDRNA2_175359_c0_seq7:4-1359(-)
MTFLRALRMMKVAKVLRLARVLQAFQDLRLMLASIAGSLSSLLWVLVMLSFILYMFALVFVQGFTALLAKGDSLGQETKDSILYYFGSVEVAILTLFQNTTGGPGWEESYNLVKLIGAPYAICFILYIAFFTFAVFNILTGVFVQHAMKFAEPEKETLVFQARRQRLEDMATMKDLCHEIDDDGSGEISLEELHAHLKSHKVRATWRLMGIDIGEAETFFRLLSHTTEDGKVEVDRFAEGAMKMKGSANALDIQTILYAMRTSSKRHDRFSRFVIEKLNSLDTSVARLAGSTSEEAISRSCPQTISAPGCDMLKDGTEDVVPPPGAEVYEPAGPPWKKKAGAKKAQPELKAYDSNSFWQLAPSERGADASPCVMPPSVTVASVSTGDDAPVVPARPLPVVASRPSSAGLRADDAAARIGGMGDCGVACCGNATVTHSEVLVNTPKPTVAMC